MNDKTKAKVEEWKKRHGKVFITKIKGEEYIYRTLTVGECEKVLNSARTSELEAQDVAFKAILFPENFLPDKLSIEDAKALSGFILDASKLFTPKGVTEMLLKSKNYVEQIFESDIFQWKLALIGVFPGYSLSDFDRMDIQEFFNLLALAEKLTKKSLINYGKLEEDKAHEENLSEVDNSNIAKGNKFLSKNELEQISADSATTALKNHWLKHKKKG